MAPQLAAQALVALLCLGVLLACSALLEWVGDTVLPEVFETGEQFGIYPSRGERFLQKALKALGVTFRLVVLGVLIWVAYQAFGVK